MRDRMKRVEASDAKYLCLNDSFIWLVLDAGFLDCQVCMGMRVTTRQGWVGTFMLRMSARSWFRMEYIFGARTEFAVPYMLWFEISLAVVPYF